VVEKVPVIMATEAPQPSKSDSVVVRHGRVASVDLFEIKESELEVFEKGSPADIQLNFALPLLTLAFEAVCVLLTATFQNPTIKTVFIVISIVGFLFGLYLLIAWSRSRTSLRMVCKTIRGRIPSDSLEPDDKRDVTAPTKPVAPSG